MRIQPIIDISEICALKGIKQAVICPGSRNAPLTISFARNNKIDTKSISDERSAGFIAIGMAQYQNNPVALICTSGTSTLNFAPAVAEAYYQNIPLIIFTADRPKEWIDQQDGQTIQQSGLYGRHVKASFDLPQDYDHADSQWHLNRIVNEAINTANRFPKGPVHVNVPLREPLYPSSDETIHFSNNIRIIEELNAERRLSEEELNKVVVELQNFTKVVIVGGQAEYENQLFESLEHFSTLHHIPVVADIISNLHGLKNAMVHADALLGNCKEDVKKALQPDLIITFGKSVISKNLKLFLRKYKPKQHWHLQLDGCAADTFQTLTRVIAISPYHFFNQISSILQRTGFEAQKRENYFRLWQAEDHRVHRSINSYFSNFQLTEFHLVNEVLKCLPKDSNLHLANSMPVRYANFIGLAENRNNINVFSNRGTSGIDGCTSTAVGNALSSGQLTVLITGDMGFFYDRNAFWHNFSIPNLRIVVLNNHGGAIFSMIDGPSGLPESETYFVTKQTLNAKTLATEHNFEYLKLDNTRKLKNILKDFFDIDGKTKILEVETSSDLAKSTLEEFKSQIKNSYDA